MQLNATLSNAIMYKTMLSYCLKCIKDTENINQRVSKTSNGKTMILSKCAICGTKKIKIYKRTRSKRVTK